MAKHVLKDATVTVNSVDLSAHVSSVTIETNRDEVDVTSMGASNKETVAGLGDASMTVEFYNDYASASVDATLFPLSVSDTAFPIVVKPTSGAVSATNPSYTMQALLFTYNPIAGSIGEANKTSVTFKNAAQSGLVRATS